MLKRKTMFEASREKKHSALWKILPVALVVFAAALALVVFYGQDSGEQQELVDLVRKGDPEFDRYSDLIVLVDSSIRMARNIAGHKMVIFSGAIENNGDRSLDAVELKLTLFNYEDPVYEVTRSPILPGAYTPPIPPMENRSFTLYLEDLPDEWKASHAEMELSGFRFGE